MDLKEAAQEASDRINLRAQTRGMMAIDADKEKAAQAIKLQEQTGTDANTIYENHDDFVRDYKSQLTQGIISSDPAIRDYVDNYPMGAKVSKDDWHNIADFNEKLDALSPHLPGSGIVGKAIRKAAESFDTGTLDRWLDSVDADTWKGPLGTASYVAWGAIGAPFALLSSTFSAGLAGLNEALTEIGGPQFARDVTGATESYLMGTSGVHAPHTTYAGAVEAAAELARRAEIKNVKDAFRAAKPYLQAGERPPVGTHPLWDEALAAEKKVSMDAYDEVMDAAKKSETKELSPDMMAAIVATKNKGSVYVNSEAVHQLYGDKVPEPGDGLLGDVPEIAKQIEDSRTTGADIDIKWADWIGRVPDEVSKALRDDLRWRPGDLTLKEAEAIPKAKEVLGEPVEEAPPVDPSKPKEVGDVILSKLVDPQTGKDISEYAPWTIREIYPDGSAKIYNPAAGEKITAPGHSIEKFRYASEAKPVETPVERSTRLKDELKEREDVLGDEPEILEPGNIRHALRQAVETRVAPRELTKGLRWAILNGRPDIVFSVLERAGKLDVKLEAKLRADVEAIQRSKDFMDAAKSEMGQRQLFPAGWVTADPVEWKSVQDLVQSGEWDQVGRKTVIKPSQEWLSKEKEVIDKLFNLMGQIAPEAAVTLRPALEIRMGEPPTPITGVYLSFKEIDPIISIAVNSTNPLGTLRHELVHFFRDYNFFTRAEWKVLRDAAVKEWINKHRIIEKYPGEGPRAVIEEAIASEYPIWALTRETTSPVGKIFQKILDFLTNVKATLKQIFGRDLTPDEIFTGIETGRIGKRRVEEQLSLERVEKAEIKEAEVPSIEEAGPTFAPGALMPKDRYARYIRLINKINDKEVQKLYNEAVRDEKKRQTPEWNREAAKMYTEVREDIDNRRDFRAQDFFRNGKFGDQTLESRPKIDPKYLSAEEKAALPSRFMSKGGFNPDELAGSFGYKTGREMIDDMVKYEKEKGEDRPGLYKDKVIANEVERRMRMRFGDLDENIMRDAREHAIGMEQFDLLYEETLQLGDMLKQQFPLTKENLRDQAKLKFNDTPQNQTALIKYTREIGKAGKDAEKAFLSGDIAGAFAQKQRQVQLQALAELAKKFEREKRGFERAAKRFNKREVDGIPAEHTNWIHDILFRIDRPPRRSRFDLDDSINRQVEKTLEDFTTKRNKAGLPEGYEEHEVDLNPNIPVADFLLDPKYTKDVESMTVGEFRAVNNSIQALIKHGRDEETALLRGENVARQRAIGILVDQLQTLRPPGKKLELPTEGPKGVRSWGRSMLVGLMHHETMWERVDKGKIGLFTRTFSFPLTKAGNEFRLLQRDFSRKLRELNKYKTDLNEKIRGDIFREPLADVPDDLKGGIAESGEFIPMTRGRLRAVLLNVGNQSNLEKLAKGYGTTPEAVMDWVNLHATQADWAFAQGVGKIFGEIQDKADLMTMNMTNTVIEKLPLGQVQTNFGPMDGWYYPMIYDVSRGGGKRINIDINPPPLIRAMTARGFERPRTGYVGPVWLTLETIGDHVGRRLRDIAFREVITDLQKTYTDPRFTAALTRNLGPEFTASLVPYLRDIAGMRGPTAAATARMERFGEMVRINTVGTLIGWNPGTVFKHTPTAYIQSFKELKNPMSLVAATKDLLGTNKEIGISNNKFMMEGAKIGDLDWKGSGELQGRRQHWYDTLGGATDEIILKPTFRHKVIETGAWAIAQSDLVASKALWLAKYREMMEELQPTMKVEQAHTEAVDMADRAVRRTHGSTAVTSRPEFMRLQGFWPKTMTSLYGFFNHVFQRNYRMAWKSKELMKSVKAGEPVARDVWDIATDFFFYSFVPGYIGYLVSPLAKDEDSWQWKMWTILSAPAFESVPVVRDLYHAASTGHDPASGILTASSKAVTDAIRSLSKGVDFYNFGDQLQHMTALAGIATGLPGQQLGRWEKFLYNYFVTRMETIRDPGDAYRAFRYGTAREPKGH